MIVVKIWGLPLTEEPRLHELHAEILKEIKEEIDSDDNLTRTFLTIGEDKKEVRVGEEMVIEISEKFGQTKVISRQLAEISRRVVCATFPKAHIEWFIFNVDLGQAYWTSPCDDGNSFALDESIYD